MSVIEKQLHPKSNPFKPPRRCQILEIGKELDEEIGISKRFKDVINRVKKSIDGI